MHDKSKHAKCLTSQFADTLGTKSDYELYATINRAQRFIKQFIVHKNDKMYLSDRTRRADLCAACWKKGQRCLFYILTLKLRAQSTLQKKKVKKMHYTHFCHVSKFSSTTKAAESLRQNGHSSLVNVRALC